MAKRREARAWIGVFGAVALCFLVCFLTFSQTAIAAGQITDRSLTLEAGSDGGSKGGGVVMHLFSFRVPTTASVGSIEFKYCLLAAGACTMPSGLVTTSAVLTAQTGATGFSEIVTTNGAPYITRTAASITGGTLLTYELSPVTNPTASNTTFYVRISTFAATSPGGSAIDSGTVAASTANQITLTGIMPESLVFCTGATVGLTGGVPDCATATAGAINFNQLFSPTDTATGTSQMAASTNAGAGYVITVNGPTLTSGSNTIAAMNVAALGTRGLPQFGLNLKLNTTLTSTVAIGAEVSPTPNGINYKGQSTTGYNTVDNFKFTTGDGIANSANGGAGGTDSQIFTVSYIVNVPGSQPAGTYTTTLTYICTPTF